MTQERAAKGTLSMRKKAIRHGVGAGGQVSNDEEGDTEGEGGGQACRCGSDGVDAGHEIPLVLPNGSLVPFLFRVPSVCAFARLGDSWPRQRRRRLAPDPLHPVCAMRIATALAASAVASTWPRDTSGAGQRVTAVIMMVAQAWPGGMDDVTKLGEIN
jgi:hypothetical protein